MAQEYVVNNLLCFLSSAKNDFPSHTLLETAISFYSYDDMREDKLAIANLLNKDHILRKNPDRKRKELKDVLDFLDEFLSTRKRVSFVSNTYKGMPPVGLEFIAPTIVKLNEDVNKINETMPKFVDIRTEVINTSDTIRQLRADVLEIKEKFSHAVTGMEAAAKDLTEDESELLKDIRSFRMSFGETAARRESGVTSPTAYQNIPPETEDECETLDKSLDEVDHNSLTVGLNDPANEDDHSAANQSYEKKDKINNLVENIREVSYSAPRSHGNERNGASQSFGNSGNLARQTPDKEGWITVRRNQRRPRQSNGEGQVNRDRGHTRPNYNIMGAKKTSHNNFKGVKRTVDVFLGRVVKTAAIEDISNYIEETFNVTPISLEPIKIGSKVFNAFKLTVLLDQRDKLFNADMWPEDVVVKKYYSRRS